MKHERLPRRSPEAVKEFLEANGWILNRTYALYEQGPLSIQEVSCRSQPADVESYARALAVGLGEVREARAAEDGVFAMRDEMLREFGGNYNHHGHWSRAIGPFGCTVKVLEQTTGGVLYIRYYDKERERVGDGTGRVTRSLRHKDKASAIVTAQEKVEELQGEAGRRGAVG